MLIIGLTGSIASGKSTVSKILASPPYNLPIVDADLIARQVVEPGTSGYNKIVERFGPECPNLLEPTTSTDGKSTLRPINRSALGQLVFGDTPEQKVRKADLNAIVHPAVAREMARQVLVQYVSGSWCVVLDIPLLFDSRWIWDLICGYVITVGVDSHIQLQRLLARDAPRLSEADARDRIISQMPFEEKAERTRLRGDNRGIVIMNNSSRDDLSREVCKTIHHVQTLHPRWWSWVLLCFPPAALWTAVWSIAMNLQARFRYRQNHTEMKKD